MHRTLRAALAATALFLAASGGALAADPKPLFASDDILHLTIRGPLSSIPRGVEEKPFPGLLTVQGAAPESLPIQLSVRGITRRRKDICSFPPLRVTFPDKPGANSVFKGEKNLKLVTHCQNSDKFQQQQLLEYAAYKLYQVLTPDSFRVRLLQIDYINDDNRPIASRLGFFTEDVDDIAQRNGQERLRGVKAVKAAQLDPVAASRFVLFQYMISNMDWSMIANAGERDCCHNSRLVGPKGATTNLIPVPYDFDYSGLVDAPYATTPAGYPVTPVTVRRFGGFCQHDAQALAYAAELAPRRAELIAVLDKIPMLDERTHRKAANYLNGFFDRIASQSDLDYMLKTCLR